jgi:hypothetical protein
MCSMRYLLRLPNGLCELSIVGFIENVGGLIKSIRRFLPPFSSGGSSQNDATFVERGEAAKLEIERQEMRWLE